MTIPPINNMTGAFSVKGQNVVVTGGNRGIGFGICEAYAQSGANVAVLCRGREIGEAAVKNLQQYGTKSFLAVCDVGDPGSVKTAADEVFRQFETVDVLVNNAGVSTFGRFLDDKDMAEWHRVINVNLNGPANMMQAIVPRMVDAGKGGCVINISSIGGQSLGGAVTHPMAPYHASKSALDMFTRNMAIEFGDYGIRVNGIAPGPTHSDLEKDLPPDAFEKISKIMPAHRFAEAIEVGALCVFLSSPSGVQITGTVIVHDGGMLLVG